MAELEFRVCSLSSSLLQLPWCRVELLPSAGMEEWISLPLGFTVDTLALLGARGFPAGPSALVFNFKHPLVIECLHITAN